MQKIDKKNNMFEQKRKIVKDKLAGFSSKIPSFSQGKKKVGDIVREAFASNAKVNKGIF
jgi:hypothetical protein